MHKNGPNTKSHYLPEFYLHGWCDQRNLLWLHYKNGRPSKQTGPGGAGYQRGLYDSSGHPDLGQLDTEADLARLEDLYAPQWPNAFHRIQNKDTKRNLARYLALTHLRNPSSRESIKETNEIFHKFFKELPPGQDEIEIEVRGQKFCLNVARAIQDSENTPQNITTGFLLNMRSVDDYTEIFFQRKWGIITADAPLFVTADNPIIVLKGACERVPFGYDTPGTRILFPLTPRKVLVIDDSIQSDGSIFRVEDARSVNRPLWDAAKEMLISASQIMHL